MPRIRREAVRYFNNGWSARKIGRYLGYHHTAVMKWVRRGKVIGDHPIPTRSSRPNTAPNRIDESLRKEIVKLRIETKRCTEVIHLILKERGIKVSKNTVHRVLDRAYLLKKRSPWKRYHPPVERPYPLKTGDLMQIDTIHRMINKKERLYVYVLIDVYSRWIYARAYEKIGALTSAQFVARAQKEAEFTFNMIQSDHGPEFGRWFISRIQKNHRYTRIGKPNDNAHIERVNRTIQEECLDKVPNNVFKINCALKKYLQYYNYKRIHLSISTTPHQVVLRS